MATAFRHSTSTPRRERLVDEIADLVVDGRINSAEILSERVIAAEIDPSLSRTPVREALALLVRDGMFDQIPQKGVKLVPVSLEEIDELSELRGPLEALIVRRLALSPERIDLRSASESIDDAMHAIEDHSLKDFSRADVQFHTGLARCAQMRTAEISLRTWMSRMRMAGAGKVLDGDLAMHEVKLQRTLIDAIAAHDALTSEHLVDQALRLAKQRAVAFFADSSVPAASPARA